MKMKIILVVIISLDFHPGLLELHILITVLRNRQYVF